MGLLEILYFSRSVCSSNGELEKTRINIKRKKLLCGKNDKLCNSKLQLYANLLETYLNNFTEPNVSQNLDQMANIQRIL